MKRRVIQFVPFLTTGAVKNEPLKVTCARKKLFHNISKNQSGFIYFKLRQIHGKTLKDIDILNRNASTAFRETTCQLCLEEMRRAKRNTWAVFMIKRYSCKAKFCLYEFLKWMSYSELSSYFKSYFVIVSIVYYFFCFA